MEELFKKITKNAHLNWLFHIELVEKIYKEYPDSYEILFPFMYSYLEECIRSLTSDYGKEKEKHVVGYKLIKLAIKENSNNKKLIELLNDCKCYFNYSRTLDAGNNRNSTVHGYIHPLYWKKDEFEKLIKTIARFSDFNIF